MNGTVKGANDCPISRFRPKPGETRGPEWIKRPQLGLLIDTWHWKTFFASRAAAAPGDPGSFTWFGREAAGQRSYHTQLFSHLTAEYAKEERGERTVQHWETKPNCENHYLDSTLLTIDGASTLGISLGDIQRNRPAAPVTLAELKRRAQQR